MVAGLLLAVACPAAQAQEDLESQRQSTQQRLKTLEDQIQRSQERLRETAEAAETSREKLQSLEREIALREELVATYERRLRQLGTERAQLQDTLQTLQNRLADLRTEYRRRVVHAYKYSRIPDLALILASRSINQMLVRIRYLQRFAQQRQDQRADVQQAAAEVRASQQQLARTRKETQELLAEARTERENLKALKADREAVIAKLRSRRSELKAELEEKRSRAQQLEGRLRALAKKIERRTESASEAERAKREAVAADLSASFENNRGRLPWPAEGAVTEPFGYREDPVYGTETYHPGIFIATNPGAPVRAVFEGTVSSVDFVPGYGTYLVIRHGAYLSVYSNFSSLDVARGDEVAAGAALGEAGTEAEPRGAGIFFAVFDRSKNSSVDPTDWLAAQ